MTLSNSVLRSYLDTFYPLSDKEYEQFSSYFFVRNFSAKEQLIKEGEIEENIYYVVKGIFRKYFRRGKDEVVTGFYREHEICLSAVSYFTGLPSSLVIEAIEPSVCIAIKRRDLEYIMSEIPAFEKIFRGVLSTLYVKKDLELMNNLRYSKKERFMQLCEEQPELLQRVPQKQLASFLEITPETFCRMKRIRYNLAKEAKSPPATGAR